MSWQLLTAVSVVTFSISMLLQRLLLHKDKGDPIAYVVIFQGLVAIILGIYSVLHGFHTPNFGRYWFSISATAILFGTGHVIYAKTLKQVEASIFAILFATYALWVMVMGVLIFAAHIGLWQILGSILIFTSIVLLAEHKGSIKLDRGILMGLLTGVVFGFATVAWVYAGKHAPDTASWTALSFAGPSLVVLITHPRSVKKMKPFFKGDMLVRMTLLGVIYSISGLTQLLAFKDGNVSLVAPLLQASIILTTLLAVIFLHERTRLWQKGVAALTCFMGVLLIVG